MHSALVYVWCNVIMWHPGKGKKQGMEVTYFYILFLDFSSLFPCLQDSISHILKCSKTRTWSMISAPTGRDQKNLSAVSTLPANWNILRCPVLIFPGIHARNVKKTKCDPKRASEMTKRLKQFWWKTAPFLLRLCFK